MIAAGGPAGKTRVTLSGTGSARPVASVTVAARAFRVAKIEADRPARTVRRLRFIAVSIRHPEVRATAGREPRRATAAILRGPRCARAPQDDGAGLSIHRHHDIARLDHGVAIL